MKYHITKAGAPGVCRASVKNCPLGGKEEHYSTPEEARAAFEKAMGEKMVSPLRRVKMEDYLSDPQRVLEEKAYRADREAVWKRSLSRGFRKASPWEEWQNAHRDLMRTPVEGAPKKVKVYRAGDGGEREYKGMVGFYMDHADEVRGDLPGRRESLFASQGPRGLSRWLRANYMNYRNSDETWRPHVMEVDPNSTYIFPIEAWEDYSWGGAPAEHFWNSGMLLSRFTEVAEKEGWDESEWEILVPQTSESTIKPLGRKALTTLLSTITDEHFYHDEVVEIAKNLR